MLSTNASIVLLLLVSSAEMFSMYVSTCGRMLNMVAVAS